MPEIGRFRPRLAFSGRRDADRPPAPQAGGEALLTSAPDPIAAERFRQACLPHLDAAYSFARFLARDPVVAEDIVQEAYLRAFRSFRTFRGESPRAWLFSIVRNCFFDWTRTARRPEPEMEEPAGDDPEAVLMRDSEAERLRAAIQALPEPFREMIVLRELEELSYKEIAAIAGVPIGTVMSRLARARRMLGQSLLGEAGPEREASL